MTGSSKGEVYLGDTRVKSSNVVYRGLQEVYGVDWRGVNSLCAKIGVKPTLRLDELDDWQIWWLDSVLKQRYREYGERLKKNRKVLREKRKQLGCYRELRSAAGLPCRGQRSKTNGKTAAK